MARDQEGFRFRRDDGSETSATWIDAQDTNVSVDAGQQLRLRFVIHEQGGSPAAGPIIYQLLYKKSTAENWARVLTLAEDSTAPIVLGVAGSPTTLDSGGVATTRQLNPPAGSPMAFVPGFAWIDGNRDPDSIEMAAAQHTEIEFGVVANNVQNGDVYQFRVAGNEPADQGEDLEPEVVASWVDEAWTPGGPDSTLSTPSVSFGSNDLAIAVIASRFTELTATGDIEVDGGSGGLTTWELIADIPYASNTRILSIFRAQQASPGAAAPVVFRQNNFGDGSGPTFVVFKIPGALAGNNGSNAVVVLDTDGNVASPLALTIGVSPDTGDIGIGIIATLDNTDNLTSDANYETLITNGPSAETKIRVDWDAGQDPNVTWTYGPSNDNASAAAFFVKKA